MKRILRFLGVSLGILIVIGVIWAHVYLNRPDSLPIKIVKVEGKMPHLDQQAFKKLLLPLVQGGFFQIDLESIQQAGLSFPWIYQVDVRRIFPDTLIIEIIEQTAVARWNDQALLNPEGDLFKPSLNTFPANLPLFYGPEDAQASMVLASFQRMNEILQPLNLQIVAINLSPRRSWELKLNNGLTLVLGRFFIWQRLQRFVKLYPQILAGEHHKALKVDLRYSNGFAIEWKK